MAFRRDYESTGHYRAWIDEEGEAFRRERQEQFPDRSPEMRDGMRRSINAHQAEKAAAEKAKRLEQVGAIYDAWKRGGIGSDRALAEVIETARGDAAAVVRVGEQVRPDITTGESR
jgi:hypothetical protein